MDRPTKLGGLGGQVGEWVERGKLRKWPQGTHTVSHILCYFI